MDDTDGLQEGLSRALVRADSAKDEGAEKRFEEAKAERAQRCEHAKARGVELDKGRCTGSCCERFYLPATPDDLRRGFETWRRGQNEQTLSLNNAGEHRRAPAMWSTTVPQEIWLIYPMVIPLGPAREEDAPTAIFPEDKNLFGLPGWFYTCKHFKDGNCTIYDHRPSMCREYPYGHGCNYATCTWNAARRQEPTTVLVEPASLRRASLPILDDGGPIEVAEHAEHAKALADS